MNTWPLDKMMKGPEYEKHVDESIKRLLKVNVREQITLCNYVDAHGVFRRCEIRCSNQDKTLTYARMKEEYIPDDVMLVRFSE